MKYLSDDSYAEAIRHHFSAPEMIAERLVGPERQLDAGYFDIVRFFGGQRIDPERVAVEHQAGEFRFADQRIAAFAREVEERLRAEGRLHDGPLATHLVDARLDRKPGSMTVQPSRYGDQAGSCFALDWEHPLFDSHGGTLREYYLNQTPSRRVADNPLAIGLGVCGMLWMRSDQKPALLTVRRSASLASLESSWGPSVAGSVDYEPSDATLDQMLRRAMMIEIEEELGLQPCEFEVIPLAYAREIYRGERPQLFCLVSTTLSRQTVVDRLRGKIEHGGEYDKFQFAEAARNRLSPDFAGTTNRECQMNCALVEEYWAGQY
jgi:hypothetical protein